MALLPGKMRRKIRRKKIREMKDDRKEIQARNSFPRGHHHAPMTCKAKVANAS
jgi:hypothetical protein